MTSNTKSLAYQLAKMAAERQVFSIENTAIITTNEEITARQTRSYLLNNWEKLTSNRTSIRILILAGIHGYEDGKLGPVDQGLQKDNESQIKVLKRKLKKMEKRNIEIEAIDVGQHSNDSLLDEIKLLETIKDFQPNLMILGICWSRLSELNDLFRANGIYPELALNQDLVTITKGKNCTLDQRQKDFITRVADTQPKNVFLWGPPGSGKTLLAAEVVKMKISHYYRQMKCELTEFNRKVKVFILVFASVPGPLLYDDLKEETFRELQKQFNFHFNFLSNLCEAWKIPWLPYEPQKCIENTLRILRILRLSQLEEEKIILFIDEVNPGLPGDWSDFNPDYENVDCILSMRYQYRRNRENVDHVATSFEIKPPSNQKVTLSHQLLKRYRCSKEVQLISLYLEKHASDAYKISGNHEDIADIEKLPSGIQPLWIDREKGMLPEKSIFESLLQKFKPVVEENQGDIMVIYDKYNHDLDLLMWLEKQGIRCFNHENMIGTEAFMVIILDVEDFGLKYRFEMVNRARNILIFVTDVQDTTIGGTGMRFVLHCMLQHSNYPDLYCITMANCPFHGMKLLSRMTYETDEKPLANHILMCEQNIFRHSVPKNLALASNELETAQKITTQPMANDLAFLQEAMKVLQNLESMATFNPLFDAPIYNVLGEKFRQNYTEFYPEENVWHLCQKLQDFKNVEAYVVFISNERKLVSLTGNGLGSTYAHSYGSLCTNILDFHTILLVNSSTNYCMVYDLDCQGCYPLAFENYCQLTFKVKEGPNAPTFRILYFLDYLNNFASDRSHMMKNGNFIGRWISRKIFIPGNGNFSKSVREFPEIPGNFIKPPPTSKCIETKTSKMNLQDFTSMDSKIGFGSILNLHDFERRFKSPMRKEPVSEAQYLLEDNEDIDALTGLKECLDLTKALGDIKDEMSKNDIVSFYVPADSILARRVLHLRTRLLGHLHHLQHKIMRQ